MKYQILIVSILCGVFCGFSQNSKAIEFFSEDHFSFKGTKYEQAQYLLRTVKPMAIIEKEDQTIPKLLGNLLNDSIATVSIEK